MPIAQVNRVRLHYEVMGEGQSCLLISGVGFGGWVWRYQIAAFSTHFRVITFDNRGVGQSDKPDETYTIDTFVTDTKGLLDALQIQKAHVLGVSLGGMVAQQLALSHPQRVDRLILCSTVFGGPNVVLPSMEVLQFMAQPSGTPEERFTKGLQFSFAQGFVERHPEEVVFIRQKMSEHRQPDYAYRRQVMVPLSFNAEPFLSKIERPTLVLAGDQDQAVPVENARRLVQKLPNAQLKILDGASHLCFIEQHELFNQTVLEFLQGNKP
ncbi:alpha/beta fold hydrolase [Candidatus Acetothermia bacterium]|nr:alpha/beta fold hydrolase [Candidatus Acetothermia bacterium]